MKLPPPPEDLSVPILIPFLLYTKPMLECDSLKVSAMVINNLEPDRPYLAEDDVVLADPKISVTVSTNPPPNLSMSEITCCKEFRSFETRLERRKKNKKRCKRHQNAITANNVTISREVLILIRCKNSRPRHAGRTICTC